MDAGRSLLALIAVSLLLCGHATAGAPDIEPNCVDRNERRVPAEFNFRQQFFAVAAPARTGPLAASAFVIYINPERTYLGRQTQQWLYLRQCAYIAEQPQMVRGERVEQGVNLRQEEGADCWAVRELLKGGKSPSILYSIENDMDRLTRDADRWREVLPGPQRRVMLSSCLKR
jgi:hypothetical protein